jgi:putative mRNA 3-end processing factor
MSATLCVEPTDRGLWCAAGGFHVDPWQPVERAVITHAHSDHAVAGCRHYLTTPSGALVLRHRVGVEGNIQTLPYGQSLRLGDVDVSLHPAGHVLGSAQVRLAHAGQVCVVSGDFKVEPDPTAEPFEPVRCDTFITESTFGLPIYRWPQPSAVFEQINQWWQGNQQRGWTSVIFAYALGKAQRLLAGVDAGIGPIAVHGSVWRFVEAYREAGVALPAVLRGDEEGIAAVRRRGLLIAPMSALGSPWLRKFSPIATAIASGWMQIRGTRRGRSVDRGFVLSDHADWPGLMQAIEQTGASRIGVTHGYSHVLHRWLTEQGRPCFVVPTRYEGEVNDAALGNGQEG